MSNELPFSQACENNKQPILDCIAQVFTQPGRVLEIGSGTGQHAVHFAASLPHIEWQPSDHPANASLARPRIQQAQLANLCDPLALDVVSQSWPVESLAGVFSANTAHIMGWPEVQAMFEGVSRNLNAGGAFCLYGPFNYGGEFTSESNQAFDAHLRSQGAHMGIRNMDDLLNLASRVELTLEKDYEMPANNRLLVWRS